MKLELLNNFFKNTNIWNMFARYSFTRTLAINYMYFLSSHNTINKLFQTLNFYKKI